jgi:hypothetical protein
MNRAQPPRRPRPEPTYVPPTHGHRLPHPPYGDPSAWRRDTYAAAFPDPYATYGGGAGYTDEYADEYRGDQHDPYGLPPHPQDRIPAQRRAHQEGAPGRRRAEPRRRSRWPIVVVCLVLVPLLVLGACVGLVGMGAKAVDDARKGGTVALGQSFRYASGVELAVSTPQAYEAPNQFSVERGNVAFESTVTITNGTSRPMSATLVTMNATVAGAPAKQVFDGDVLHTQDIAAGQQLKVPFRFQVPKGTTGPLQISVQDTLNEPVFFTGNL